MTHAASVSLLGPEFEDFLFAPIGEDRNGMQLSVLSALARRDVDPWQEAAKLARLPTKTATQRLVSLIAPLPDGPLSHLDLGMIAARLIERLPRRAGSNVLPRETFLGIRAMTNSDMIFIFIGFAMILLLGATGIILSGQSPRQVDYTHAPASNTISPEVSSPSFAYGY